MKIHDRVVVPCKEPDLTRGDFPLHHDNTLKYGLDLYRQGRVGAFVLSGRYAMRYRKLGITPWFGTECDSSADRMFVLAHEAGIVLPEEVVLRDRNSMDSLANIVHSGEDYLDGTGSVLMIAAKERIERLKFLGRKLLHGVVGELDFEVSCVANDPWLEQKEIFTHGIQEWFLADVPDGRAAWPVLRDWFDRGVSPDLSCPYYDFWDSFDLAEHQMPRPSDGASLDISAIVANMNPEGLSPVLLEYAAATARGLTPANGQPYSTVTVPR